MITINCKECNKEFKVRPYRKDIAMYCSRECMYSSKIRGENISKAHKRNGYVPNNNRYIKGHRHSEETKLKMSMSRIGKVPHNKKPDVFITCIECGNKRKIVDSLKNTAKFCSRICMNKNKDKGKTLESKKIRTSLKYRKWRDLIFKRDNYTCLICGIRNNKSVGKTIYLNADHIKPFALFPALRFDINNGRTLCKDCHKKTDTFGSKIFKYKLAVGQED
jgi:hypothetical protein